MARIHFEPRFQFRSIHRLVGEVDLQIFRRRDGIVVAVVSEHIRENGDTTALGVSATDGIAQIATAIVTQLDIQFDYLIEHYPQHGPLLSLARSNSQTRETHEQFYLVTLRWHGLDKAYTIDQAGKSWAWKQISRAVAEQIIGESFYVAPLTDAGE